MVELAGSQFSYVVLLLASLVLLPGAVFGSELGRRRQSSGTPVELRPSTRSEVRWLKPSQILLFITVSL